MTSDKPVSAQYIKLFNKIPDGDRSLSSILIKEQGLPVLSSPERCMFPYPLLTYSEILMVHPPQCGLPGQFRMFLSLVSIAGFHQVFMLMSA